MCGCPVRNTTPPPPFSLSYPLCGWLNTGTVPNTLGEKGEAPRLMETLTLTSVGKRSQELYLAKSNTWVGERLALGKAQWLQHNPGNPNEVTYALMEFMACRCYLHNDQQ